MRELGWSDPGQARQQSQGGLEGSHVVHPSPLLLLVDVRIPIARLCLADFINEGHLTRHLRRMRRLYAQRRETFMPAFEAALGAHLELRRTDTGIQLVATFRRPTDDRRFAAAAIAAGVNVSPYSLQFRHGGGTPGLVLGFAATGDRAQRRGLSRLAGVAAQIYG